MEGETKSSKDRSPSANGPPRKIVKKFEIDSVQILDDQGNIHDGCEAPVLSQDRLKDGYELMKFLRTFDSKAVALQRQGRMGAYSEFKGEEAIQVGIAMALRKQDWFFPTYRDSAAIIARGVPPEYLLRYWSGDEAGQKFPERVNVFPIAIPVASQIPHAVGGAWALKYRSEDAISLVTIGDGGTSKADFYEGMNLAGVFAIPVVCVIQNNQYAISLPREYQTHTATLAQKGFAFGIEAVQVDGNDLLGVHLVLDRAIEKARRGDGPTLIEAITYRLGHHTTATGDEPYRSQAEIERWKHRDPIERLRMHLEKIGIWNHEYESEVDQRVKQRIDDSVKKFELYPRPKPEDMFRFTYSKEPAKLHSEEESMLKDLSSKSAS